MAAQSRAKVGSTSIVCFIIISLKTICDCTEEESRVLASDVALKQARRKLDDIGGKNLSSKGLAGRIVHSLSDLKSLQQLIDGNPDLCLFAPCKKERNILVPLVAAIVSALVIILIAFLILWIYRRKRAAKVDVKSIAKREGSLKLNSREFTYSEIVSMTNNFERVLVKGGFGTVYLGYLVDGTQVAVKMLCPSSTQASIQFRTEAQFLIRVHHRNLASCVGYCNDSRNFAIIYEYMAYGNLEEYLLGNSHVNFPERHF
ncbi:hypothetical protein Pint_29552 [Pistacia integerrima]|uniref:Uncharacterized protein n=1 Tax=Pistacia integerrima TaxID=434235 RepID=A0ACC0X055_9ROSI|nr:hypothetical protein Pint_29552 [Pistacia integerrima]